MITGFAKGGRASLVKGVLETIKKKSLKLDMIAYSAIIGGVARVGMFQEAKGTHRSG